MTQPAKRNPARDKKVPKYMQYDDTQYGLHSIPRALQSKEIRSSHLEINQLAKLFHKFVTNANQNYRDHHQKLSIQGGEAVEQSKLQMQNSKDIGRFNFQKKTNQDQKHYYNVSSRKPREHYERALLQQYKSNPKPETKKPNTIFKTPSSTPQNQSLSFKANKKDNPAISIENFKYSTEQSGLIKFTKEANQGRPAKSKQGKKKEAGQKPANEREQLKLFKRQSYHAAIAYNIHIKQFHSGTHPSAKNIDPTFNSRKLRQMAVPS